MGKLSGDRYRLYFVVFQAEDGIRDLVRSRGLGDVYKRQAYTSEQAARMMAMQNAKNNALDIAEFLTLSYNKSRQEKITNEILDLNSGQL